jgi:hypothetical protein
VGEKGQPVLTQTEMEEKHSVEWHPIDVAYDLITSPQHDYYQRKYIQLRDNVVLLTAIEYLHYPF